MSRGRSDLADWGVGDVALAALSFLGLVFVLAALMIGYSA